MNKANVEAIGQSLGNVKQVDAPPNRECRGQYIRVRANIDINQPLCRSRFINMGDLDPLWISFQYERMPIFCYWCGLINHDKKDCKLWTDNGCTLNKNEQQCGPWLQASTTNLQ